MSKADEPAFPEIKTTCDRDNFYEETYSNVESKGGLTKRELFAAIAMAGAMVNADIDSLCAEGAAEVAVKLADALLMELSK